VDNRGMVSRVCVKWRVAALALSAGCAVGCATAPRPVLSLNHAEKKVARAQAVNAKEAPEAALHLKMAEDQVRTAKALMREDENDDARHSLRRAEVDAELAEALARREQAKRDAGESQQRLEELKQRSADK